MAPAVTPGTASGYQRLSLWWEAVPVPLPARPALTEDLDVDVCIVGAGFTGLWTAYSLALADPTLRIAVLEREVADWGRFQNRRQVASYTGLCPSEHSSGGSRLQGSITRHGNPRLRHVLIEAAWRLVRYQPTYHTVAKWQETLRAASPGRRKKIIVAIARQLAVDLWRLATQRACAAQLGLVTS